MTIVAPGGTIGIVGGGQLGRMLAGAATRLGLKVHIYSDTENPPAADCAAQTTIASYEDNEAIDAFAAGVDVVTYEFENLPVAPLDALARSGVRVAPTVDALRTAQDRLREKEFAESLGARVAPFARVDGPEEILDASRSFGAPTILKTRRFGYDGKGQARLPSPDDGLDAGDATRAWEAVGARPCILESLVDFVAEISVIGARAPSGEMAFYDPPRNEHADGILRRSVVPSGAAAATCDAAIDATRRLLTGLDYVGVVAVEFFVMADGGVILNEFAPRVHNSGHWTEDACVVGQFEQHIRAICGWPLGNPARLANAEMINLIGDDVWRWADLAADPSASLRLYGKSEARAGRKMGHVTRLSPATG